MQPKILRAEFSQSKSDPRIAETTAFPHKRLWNRRTNMKEFCRHWNSEIPMALGI